MPNDTRHLSFQSFQRNQTILEDLNNYILHLKSQLENIESKFSSAEIYQTRNRIINFLLRLNRITNDLSSEPNGPGLFGLDKRYKSFIKQYLEARKKKTTFKSVLFRESPEIIIKELENENSEELEVLIQSLVELEKLVEDHILLDLKEVIGDI